MIFTRNTKQILVWIVIIGILIGGVWLAWYFGWQGGNHLPEEFAEARREGGFVAEQIVFFGHQSLAGLEQIGGLDEVGKYAEALERVREELERNRQARDEALLLSSHLGTMAAYLSEIKPPRAQALATEAVGHEVGLVNRLLRLHGLLASLFELLEGKFEGRIESDDERVRQIIFDINKEIKAINGLNLKFNKLMERFDKFYEYENESVDKNDVDTN